MRRIGVVVCVWLGLTSVATGQTTVTRTDRLVLLSPPAKSSETACLWRDATSGMIAVGTCATGDITGVSFTLPSIFSAVSACTSGDCAFTFSLANQTAYSVFARGSGTGTPSFQALADGHVPDNLTLGTVSGTPTFSGAVTFGSTLSSSLIPTTTDTYNLGSSTKLWNEGFLAQLNAVLFAEQTATLFGGWSVVGKNAGSFPARIASTDTQVDFGKAMTVGHFITIRAHDEGGSLPTAEFMQVGALVSGTTYTVTRNLSGLGAKNWPSGTSYLVSGTTGDGRIELRAYSTPQIAILSQGATYNAQTEHIRLGYLDGMPGMAAGKIGIYIGNLSSAGLSYYDGALSVRGSITVTGGNAETTTGSQAKADAAQSAAVSTASSDATTKANAAEAAATAVANTKATTDLTNVAAGTVRSKTGWQAGADTTKIDGGQIYADSVTATQIAAMQLSAISADLGTITAGTVTGATLQTAASCGSAATACTRMTSAGIATFNATPTNLITLDHNGLEFGAASSASDFGRLINFSDQWRQGYVGSELRLWGDGLIQIGEQTPTNYNAAATKVRLTSDNGGSSPPSCGSVSLVLDATDTTAALRLSESDCGSTVVANIGAQGFYNTAGDWTVGGTLKLQNCGGYICRESSSKRFKSDIKDAPLALRAAKVLDLRPVTYKYTAVVPGYTQPTQLGVLAEDVDALGLPGLVSYDQEGQPEGVMYDRIALYLIPIIKEQQAQIAALEARVAALEAK